MDTSEDAWRHLQKGLRKMTPQQRFQRAIDLTAMAHTMALSELRRQFPHDEERTLRLRLLARTVDAATMRAAFNWPDEAADARTPSR